MPRLTPFPYRVPCLLAVLAVLAALAVAPRAALAQAPPKGAEAPPAKKDDAAAKKDDTPPSHFADATPPASAFPAKRAVPDYTGRPPPPTTAGDVLIWVPRLVVSPVYLVTEYGIRRPLGGLVSGVEHDRLVQRLLYFFSFGGNDRIGFLPTAFVDFGVLPSVGVYFYWDDALATGNHLRVHFGTWGPDWLNVSVTDRYDLGKHSTMSLRASYLRRDDNPFFGLGPDSKQDNESRYGASTVDVGPSFDLEVTPGARLATAVGVRDTVFHEGTCCGDPSLQRRIADGQLDLPPRLFDGYAIGYQRATITLDSRRPRPSSQTGLRLALDGQPAFDFSHKLGSSWVRYGATAGAFWDVTGKARVVSVSVTTRFADPIHGSGSDIPFTELVSLGGSSLMRGYLEGRLIGRSAAVATLGYEWPIWAFLDGTLQVSTGNVFGAGLRDFETGKLRLSTGLGVRSNGSPDNQFEVITGFGTDTFEDGAHITSFRLAFGATRGF